MTKNYFTDEHVKEIAKQSGLLFEHRNECYIKKLKALMNLAVETAIGEPAGELNVDYQGFVSYKNKTNLPEGYHNLYSVKELEN